MTDPLCHLCGGAHEDPDDCPPPPRSAAQDAIRTLQIAPFAIAAFWTLCAWLKSEGVSFP